MNTMTVDPMIAKDDPPATISKIGFDCTIPWGEKWVAVGLPAVGTVRIGGPAYGGVIHDRRRHRSEDGVIDTQRAPVMEGNPAALQRAKLSRYVYRAFGRLRSRLGRVVQPPFFPYAFSDTGDFIGDAPAAPLTSIDRLHHKS
jgi:4-hydroxy-3-polyprenylbenzoate decarboxylase